MKLFLFVIAVSFIGSVLPGVRSIRTSTQLSSIMDSSVMFNVQQYGAKADGISDNSKVRLTKFNKLKWVVASTMQVVKRLCNLLCKLFFVDCYRFFLTV